MRPLLRCAFVVALMLAGVVPALAQPINAIEGDVIQRVERMYKQLYYDEAMLTCNQALAGGGNDRQTTLALLRWKGILEATQGQRDDAIDSFRALLSIDPGTQLPSHYAPRIQKAFAAAKAPLTATDQISVEFKQPNQVERGRTFQLSMEVTHDPYSLAGKAALHLRTVGAPNFESYLVASSPFDWQLQTGNLSGIREAGALEYYVTVLDRQSNELLPVGSATQPFLVPLAEPSPEMTISASSGTPWYKTWWFWTAVGVVVAGAGVGAGLYLTQSDSINGTVTVDLGQSGAAAFR